MVILSKAFIEFFNMPSSCMTAECALVLKSKKKVKVIFLMVKNIFRGEKEDAPGRIKMNRVRTHLSRWRIISQHEAGRADFRK